VVSKEGLPTHSHERSLEALLRKTINDTLKLIFNSKSAGIILRKAEERGFLKSAKSEDIEVFSVVLRELLGSSSLMIEEAILRSLHSKLGLKFIEKAGYRFSDYVNELKQCGR